MLLIIMRHGIAEEGEPDEARKLTPKGKERVVRIAKAMKSMGLKPDFYLCSHRVRAIQTAEAVMKVYGEKGEPRKTDDIDFYSPWEAFAAAVNGVTAGEPDNVTVLASGHQPQVGMLVNMALSGTDADMALKKGCAVGISFEGNRLEAGQGTLEFALTHGATRELKL